MLAAVQTIDPALPCLGYLLCSGTSGPFSTDFQSSLSSEGSVSGGRQDSGTTLNPPAASAIGSLVTWFPVTETFGGP